MFSCDWSSSIDQQGLRGAESCDQGTATRGLEQWPATEQQCDRRRLCVFGDGWRLDGARSLEQVKTITTPCTANLLERKELFKRNFFDNYFSQNYFLLKDPEDFYQYYQYYFTEDVHKQKQDYFSQSLFISMINLISSERITVLGSIPD